ncbi:hypothetical protein IMAU60210_01796 [Lactobacillus helveticus]|nr:hypothetical protein [Lactobacillus helveticus]
MEGAGLIERASGTKINPKSSASPTKPPRHPNCLIISAMIGLKIVPPSADSPREIPITVPNFSLNHLLSKTGIDKVIAIG